MQTTVEEAAPIRPFKFYDRPVSLQGVLQSIVTAFTTAVQVLRSPTYVCLEAPFQEEKIPVSLVHKLSKVPKYLDTIRNPPRPSRVDVQRVQQALLASSPNARLFLYGRVGRPISFLDSANQPRHKVQCPCPRRPEAAIGISHRSAYSTRHIPSLILD